jgi:hypothetical protein
MQFNNQQKQKFYDCFPNLLAKSTGSKKMGSFVEVEPEEIQLDQEFFAQTQFNNNSLAEAAVNFFLMKSKPPVISNSQIIEFLNAFYGGSNTEPDLSEQELKYLYNLGYKNLIDQIKVKIKIALKQI